MRRCSSARSASRPTRSASQPMRRCSSARSASWPTRPASQPMRRCNSARSASWPTRRCHSAWSVSWRDATMQFRVVSAPADATDGLADVNGYLGQAELRALIRSILADMKPREREVIELSFRHDLDDNDLAIVLGVPWSRAHALASRTRGRLEKSFGALRTALAGRQACPVLGELLADWDGQLTEQTRDLVVWHIEQCQTCAQSRAGRAAPDGSFRPAAAGPAPSGTAGEGLEPLLPPPLRMRWLTADGWSGARNRHGPRYSRRRSGG